VSRRNTVLIKGNKKNVFGPQLAKLREGEGLTLDALSAILQRRGWDISIAGLGHIESQRRSLTDAELLELLAVLKGKLTDLEPGNR